MRDGVKGTAPRTCMSRELGLSLGLQEKPETSAGQGLQQELIPSAQGGKPTLSHPGGELSSPGSPLSSHRQTQPKPQGREQGFNPQGRSGEQMWTGKGRKAPTLLPGAS